MRNPIRGSTLNRAAGSGVNGDRSEPGLKYAVLSRRVPFLRALTLKHEGLWSGPIEVRPDTR